MSSVNEYPYTKDELDEIIELVNNGFVLTDLDIIEDRLIPAWGHYWKNLVNTGKLKFKDMTVESFMPMAVSLILSCVDKC